jgi:hypothetical protein
MPFFDGEITPPTAMTPAIACCNRAVARPAGQRGVSRIARHDKTAVAGHRD